MNAELSTVSAPTEESVRIRWQAALEAMPARQAAFDASQTIVDRADALVAEKRSVLARLQAEKRELDERRSRALAEQIRIGRSDALALVDGHDLATDIAGAENDLRIAEAAQAQLQAEHATLEAEMKRAQTDLNAASESLAREAADALGQQILRDSKDLRRRGEIFKALIGGGDLHTPVNKLRESKSFEQRVLASLPRVDDMHMPVHEIQARQRGERIASQFNLDEVLARLNAGDESVAERLETLNF